MLGKSSENIRKSLENINLRGTNPVTTTDSVSGYEAISIQSTSNSWGGLALSSGTNARIDGSIGSTDWWYSIGATTYHESKYPCIPGTVRDKIELYIYKEN